MHKVYRLNVIIIALSKLSSCDGILIKLMYLMYEQ